MLCSLYLDNFARMRMLLTDLSFKLPHYNNIDWRLDVQLASRCLRQQVVGRVCVLSNL